MPAPLTTRRFPAVFSLTTLIVCSLVPTLVVILVAYLFAIRRVCVDKRIRRPAATTHGRIPGILIKTGPAPAEDLPESVVALFRQTQRDNPWLSVEYFDNARCDRLIEQVEASPEFDEVRIGAAMRSLVPGAYKADIFRYCALWSLGGVYSDLTQQFLVPIDTLVDAGADRLVLVRDRSAIRVRPLQSPSMAVARESIQVSFMAAQPRQQEYASAIRRAVANVTQRFYGSSPLDITGPVMFGQVVHAMASSYRMELIQGNSDGLQLIASGKIAVRTKLPDHKRALRNAKHYSWYWMLGRVYRDGGAAS